MEKIPTISFAATVWEAWRAIGLRPEPIAKIRADLKKPQFAQAIKAIMGGKCAGNELENSGEKFTARNTASNTENMELFD